MTHADDMRMIWGCDMFRVCDIIIWHKSCLHDDVTHMRIQDYVTWLMCVTYSYDIITSPWWWHTYENPWLCHTHEYDYVTHMSRVTQGVMRRIWGMCRRWCQWRSACGYIHLRHACRLRMESQGVVKKYLSGNMPLLSVDSDAVRAAICTWHIHVFCAWNPKALSRNICQGICPHWVATVTQRVRPYILNTYMSFAHGITRRLSRKFCRGICIHWVARVTARAAIYIHHIHVFGAWKHKVLSRNMPLWVVTVTQRVRLFTYNSCVSCAQGITGHRFGTCCRWLQWRSACGYIYLTRACLLCRESCRIVGEHAVREYAVGRDGNAAHAARGGADSKVCSGAGFAAATWWRAPHFYWYGYVCVCARACVCVCVCGRMCIYMLYIDIDVYIQIDIDMYIFTYTYVYLYVCIYVYIYKYIFIFMYIFLYKHVLYRYV